MPRRPPRLLVIASAALLACVLAAWVRSYWRVDELSYEVVDGDVPTSSGRTYRSITSGHGLVRFFVARGGRPRVARTGVWHFESAVVANRPILTWHDGIGRQDRWFESVGIRYYARGGSSPRRSTALDVCFWLLVVPAAIPLAWALLADLARVWHAMRGRRFSPGHCQGCGYDLTGNASGRCPECGREAGEQAAQVRA